MRIKTKISGIPCVVDCEYDPGQPMRITGTGFGDVTAPEPESFEIINVYARGKKPAHWLAKLMTPADEERIFREFKQYLEEINHANY